MTHKLRNTARLTCLVVLAVLSLPAAVTAAEKTLPNTQPLTITQPLDEFMIDGINRFCLRELAASPARREKMWNRDFSSPEAYEKSIAPNRERFREYIGAVDKRLTEQDAAEHRGFMEIDNFWGAMEPGLSSTKNYLAQRIRWDVLDGVTGEGLILIPRSDPVRDWQSVVIVIPDADWTPDAISGAGSSVPAQAQLARRLVEAGFLVIVPSILSRSDESSGSPYVAYTNQTHREFVYRQAFEMGRHVIGYEVQKILAVVDIVEQQFDREAQSRYEFEERTGQKRPPLHKTIGMVGAGEGALLALYAAALDRRVDATLCCGYFQQRENVWREPIYRNVWGLLTEFGDAELASLIAPRPLVIEACGVLESSGPASPREGRRGGAAPGRIETATLASVRVEYDRALPIFEELGATENLHFIASGEGDGLPGTTEALTEFSASLGVTSDFSDSKAAEELKWNVPDGYSVISPQNRERRQLDELQRHVQNLMRLSPKVRDQAWAKGDRSSVEKWDETSAPLRDWVYDELIGRLPKPTMPMNPKSRLVIDEPEFLGYEITLDCYRDIVAGGILLLPKDLKPGEKRPVVVCQHGLEGTPMDTITEDQSVRSWNYYKGFAAVLCKRGFIVYAPQNPYRGQDRFRTIQRKSNPLKRSLFSYIIPQHQRTLDWLATLPNVDSKRIAFYGLSYGGKTAVRVPPMLTQGEDRVGYCLSICSADFNEWVKKNVSNEDRYSYLFTGEYEIFEWNMGHVANYAELSSLMAPRPFMVERGHDDGVAPDEWVAWEFAKVRRHYDKLGIGGRAEIEFFNGPHSINGQGTYRFLHRHLNWPSPETN
ncbi:MAG: hypothetical protein O2945_10165 [Planctomycetota bacterium]|nr:hypothetical protein [Planctomycetota bacterium]